MDLLLSRKQFEHDGIFSALTTQEGGDFVAATLEHAYPTLAPGAFLPKIPPGEYKCVRGMHQLASMDHPFETFEITGVFGHTNILFHTGNFNNDSEGCVLLGLTQQGNMITGSRLAFSRFIELQKGLKCFSLKVA